MVVKLRGNRLFLVGEVGNWSPGFLVVLFWRQGVLGVCVWGVCVAFLACRRPRFFFGTTFECYYFKNMILGLFRASWGAVLSYFGLTHRDPPFGGVSASLDTIPAQTRNFSPLTLSAVDR